MERGLRGTEGRWRGGMPCALALVGAALAACATAWVVNVDAAWVRPRAVAPASLWAAFSRADLSTLTPFIPTYTLLFVFAALLRIRRGADREAPPPTWPFGRHFAGTTMLLGFMGTLVGLTAMLARDAGGSTGFEDFLPGLRTALFSTMSAIAAVVFAQAVGAGLRTWHAAALQRRSGAAAEAGVLQELEALGDGFRAARRGGEDAGRALGQLTAGLQDLHAGLAAARADLDTFRQRAGVDLADVIQAGHRELHGICLSTHHALQVLQSEGLTRRHLADRQQRAIELLVAQLAAETAQRRAAESERAGALFALGARATTLEQVRRLVTAADATEPAS